MLLEEVQDMLDAKYRAVRRLQFTSLAELHELEIQEHSLMSQAIALQRAVTDRQPDSSAALRPLIERIAHLRAASSNEMTLVETRPNAKAAGWDAAIRATSKLIWTGEQDVGGEMLLHLERLQQLLDVPEPNMESKVLEEERNEVAALGNRKASLRTELESLRQEARSIGNATSSSSSSDAASLASMAQADAAQACTVLRNKQARLEASIEDLRRKAQSRST